MILTTNRQIETWFDEHTPEQRADYLGKVLNPYQLELDFQHLTPPQQTMVLHALRGEDIPETIDSNYTREKKARFLLHQKRKLLVARD